MASSSRSPLVTTSRLAATVLFCAIIAAPVSLSEDRPVLPPDAADRAADLETRIAELKLTGSDESLAEALGLAGELLALRLKHQGPAAGWTTADGEPAEWYEVGDARREVGDIELRIAMAPESRARLSEADAAEETLVELRRERKRDEALELARKQLTTYRELLGEENASTADGLASVGKMLSSKGDYTAAVPFYRDSLAMYRRVLGGDHPRVATAMNNLAVRLKRLAQYDEAEALYRHALAINRHLFGEKDLEVASNLNNLAQLLRKAGDLDVAEPFYRESLAIRRELLGNDDLKVAASLTNLAGLLRLQAEYEEAEAMAREALAIRRSQLGDRDADVAGSLDTLAVILKGSGDYAAAEPMYREALAIRRDLLGNEHPHVALSLINLSALLERTGVYDEAEILLREALAIDRKRFGPRHPNVAGDLLNLGRIAEDRGNYAAAEVVILEALTIQREYFGEEHRYVATSMSSLAGLLQSKGEYAASEKLCRESLAMRRKLFGDEHDTVAVSLNNLASLADRRGDLESAESLYREALAIQRKRLGEEHAEVATCIHNLAGVLAARGDLDQAEELDLQALAMRRRILGDQHPAVAASFISLAALKRKKGESRAAESLYRDALEMRRQLLGDAHPKVILTMNMLADLLFDRGDAAAAERYWSSAADSFEQARLHVGYGGLERAQFGARFSPLKPLAICRARKGEAAEAWQALESDLARGLLDTVSAGEARPLTPAEAQREQDLIYRLGVLDERIGSLSADPEKSDEKRSRVETFRRERDALQAELVRFEAEMTVRYGAAAGDVYELSRIQAQLGSDSAMVAWIDIKGDPRSVNPGGEHWACLVRKTGVPTWIRLPGSGKDGAWTDADEDAPAEVRRLLSLDPSDASTQRVEHLFRKLFNQRLAPLEPHLAGIRHLIVLPAGWMAGIPLEALTDDYTVSYAPSGTMYAWLGEKTRTSGKPQANGVRPDSLLAVGDPVFASPEEPEAEQAPAAAEVTPSRELLLAGLLTTARGRSYEPLPATRHEVEAIAALFHVPGDESRPTVLLGAEASEERLDALSRSGRLARYRYIHLATHGEMDDRRAMNSAMILSRGNRADEIEQAVEGREIFDGRLTAGQIVRTWRLDTDLVTLSGCDTALGRKLGGEGYLGFSQALFVAGARSLLLSLWKVDDRATMLLMTRFYENALGIHHQPRTVPGGEDYPAGVPLPRAEALGEAKAWLRGLTVEQLRHLASNRGGGGTTEAAAGQAGAGDTNPHQPYQDPRYWASFILIGSPD